MNASLYSHALGRFLGNAVLTLLAAALVLGIACRVGGATTGLLGLLAG